MNEPEGTGSRAEDPGEEIALPSWIDAAIAKSQSEGAPAEVAETPPDSGVEPAPDPRGSAPPSAPPDFEPIGGHEWMAAHPQGMVTEPRFEEATPAEPYAEEELFAEETAPSQATDLHEEPFPSFLGRPTAPPSDHDETAEPQREPSPPSQPLPSFLSRRTALQPESAPEPQAIEPPEAASLDEVPGFEDGEELPEFAGHERPETIPMPEPVPIPVAPIRRRGPAGPWLMAALFFAAAALVLAVLIWLRPLPR